MTGRWFELRRTLVYRLAHWLRVPLGIPFGSFGFKTYSEWREHQRRLFSMR